MSGLLYDDETGARRLTGDITDHGADVLEASKLCRMCLLCGARVPVGPWCDDCREEWANL